MNLATYYTTIAMVLPLILLMLTWVLSARSHGDREKSSPFECGFDPKSTARIPFSMRFFLLAIIFIVFDIEIVLLMPIPIIIMCSNPYTSILVVISFLLILLLGLVHEWNEGSLDWAN